MNLPRTLSYALLICCALVLVSSPVALAAEAKRRINVGGEVYTLYPYEQVYLGRHYFGQYAFAYEFTAGTLLHLFPNGRFVISDWIDVGGSRTLATGSFEVREPELILKFSKFRPGMESIASRFSDLRIAWGSIENPEYVTGFEALVFSKTEWEKLAETPRDVRYMRRTREYNDWERILSNLTDKIDKREQ